MACRPGRRHHSRGHNPGGWPQCPWCWSSAQANGQHENKVATVARNFVVVEDKSILITQCKSDCCMFRWDLYRPQKFCPGSTFFVLGTHCIESWTCSAGEKLTLTTLKVKHCTGLQKDELATNIKKITPHFEVLANHSDQQVCHFTKWSPLDAQECSDTWDLTSKH